MFETMVNIILSFIMGFTSGMLLADIMVRIETEEEEQEDEGE